MLKNLFLFLFLIPFYLCAMPYYDECENGKGFIVIFYGHIDPEDEPEVRMLQRKFIEYNNGERFNIRHMRHQLEKQLHYLGIDVEVVKKAEQ